MKNILIICALSFSFIQTAICQKGQFYVEVSADSVLVDNYFEVSFIIENLDGNFEAPDFADFQVMSGPNTSMSMSIINNKMTRSSKYSYLLKPIDIGRYFIEPAYLISEEESHETDPIEIIVSNENTKKTDNLKKAKKANRTETIDSEIEPKTPKRTRKKL